MTKKLPKFVQDDMWLQPYSSSIIQRVQAAGEKEKELAGNGSLYEFAGGHLYFGLHKTEDGWVMREWAPNATFIYLTGAFNDGRNKKFEFYPLENGIWELKLPGDLKHGDLYAFLCTGRLILKRVPRGQNMLPRTEPTFLTHRFNPRLPMCGAW